MNLTGPKIPTSKIDLSEFPQKYPHQREIYLKFPPKISTSKVDLSVVRGLVKSVPGAKCQDFGKVCLLDDEESEGYGLHQIPAKETA